MLGSKYISSQHKLHGAPESVDQVLLSRAVDHAWPITRRTKQSVL
jgi:hypothetical protein